MKKGKKNKEASEGIDTTFLDTRVDNETTKKTDKRRAIPLSICITQTKRRSNLKTGIQIRLSFLPKHNVGIYFIVSEVHV
jgi:hypothetical protein